MYPNPANDHVIIDNGNVPAMAGYSIRIVNVRGQAVFDAPINTQQFNIAASTLGSTGVYLLHVIDPSQQVIDTRTLILN